MLKVRRLGYVLGAEITGVDLRETLDDATVAAIRTAWLENLVLCFPGQRLERAQLFAFAKRFGDLEDLALTAAIRDRSDALPVTILTEKTVDGTPWNGLKLGHNWHSDQTHTIRPSEGTFLSCKQIPPAGGDTMFANLYASYEALSPAMQRIVDGLWVVHYRSLPVGGIFQGTFEASRNARERILIGEEEAESGPHAVRPAVLVHPETGRKALFLGTRARRFVGLSDEESAALFTFLNEHVVKHEFLYRHKWTVDDLILWDNRCVLHIALCDYDFQRDARFMIRCRTSAPESGFPFNPGDDPLHYSLHESAPASR